MNRRSFIIGSLALGASTVLGKDPIKDVLEQRYAILEDNTIYKDDDTVNFRQLIGWNVDQATKCMRVDFYIQINKVNGEWDRSRIPSYCAGTDDYRAVFWDRCLRCVISKEFIQTETPQCIYLLNGTSINGDPEMQDRKFREKGERPDLLEYRTFAEQKKKRLLFSPSPNE